MNILIVESETDEFFIQALVNKFSIDNKVCCIDEFKHSSLSKEKLQIQIASALRDINRGAGVSKIGIILDLDNSNQMDRISLINSSITQALIDLNYAVPDVLLVDVNTFISIPIDSELNIKMACYFTNVDGQGELETILKEISTQESIFADCLEHSWRNCITQKGKNIVGPNKQGDITEKEILKLWVDFYKRFDTLKKSDRDYKNTNWKGIMLGNSSKDNVARGESIFDLDAPILSELKSFLGLFN